MGRRGPTIANTALEIIRQRGPQDLTALTDEMVAAGRTVARNPSAVVEAALSRDNRFIAAQDGRWCLLADQLEGCILTHRLTAVERRDDIVILDAGDHLLERLASGGRRFVSGAQSHLGSVRSFYDLPWHDEFDPSRVFDDWFDDPEDAMWAGLSGNAAEREFANDRAAERETWQFLLDRRWDSYLLGPLGWLPQTEADELLGLALRAGALDPVVIRPADILAEHVHAAARRIAELASRESDTDTSRFAPPWLPVTGLLAMIATEAPEILQQPLPPFADLLSAAGLELSGDQVYRLDEAGDRDPTAARWIAA